MKPDAGRERSERERELARLRQRRRRAVKQRIDYYPEPDVLEVIDALSFPHTPLYGRPAILTHIVRDWARKERRP